MDEFFWHEPFGSHSEKMVRVYCIRTAINASSFSRGLKVSMPNTYPSKLNHQIDVFVCILLTG